MLVELLLVRHPIYFIHAVHTFGLGLIYSLFTLVYYFVDGTGPLGHPFIYPILDWGGSPGKTTLVVLGVLVLTVFLHVIICIVQRLRHQLHKKIFGSPTSFDLKNDQQLSV